MRNLGSTIKMELLTYRRSYFVYLILVTLALYIATGYFHFLGGEYIQAGQMLQSSTYINMASALFGLFFGVIMAQKEEKVHFQEILSSLPGNKTRPIAKLIAWFIVSIIITILAYFMISFAFNIVKSEVLFFKKDILIYIFTYWGGVLFSTGILGYFIENMAPFKKWNIGIIIVVWLFMSPFNKLFSVVIPSTVLSISNIGEVDATSIYDNYHGLNISTYSIMNLIFFLLFSLLLFLIGIFIKNYSQLNKKEKMISSISIVVVLALCASSLMMAVSPIDGTYFRNYQDLYAVRDYTFYSQESVKEIDLKDTSLVEGIEVLSYDINLSVREMDIIYTANVEIENTHNKKWIPFTLYHNLDVRSVKINNKSVNFNRESDWLMIEWPDGLISSNVTFEVKGNTGSFNPITPYSFFLSSTFPWYPVLGEYRVVEKDMFSNLEFNTIQLSKSTKFHIIVDDKDEIFSNLDKVAHNEFGGISKGISLFKGMVISKEYNEKEYLVPPDMFNSVQSVLPIIERKIEFISDIVDIPRKKMPNKIYVKPTYSSLSQYALTATGDELLVSADHLTPYLIGQLGRVECVFRAFYWNNEYNQASATHAYIFEILLEYLEQPSNSIVELYASLENSKDSKEQFLIDLSKVVLDIYNENPEYLKKLIKNMYHSIRNNKNTPIDIWLNKVIEIKQGGTL